MQPQDLIILIYIILRIVPSSYLCYYPFLDDLRFSKKATACGFFALVALEFIVYIATGRNFDKLNTLYGMYLPYVIYYFFVIKGNTNKKLFCVLLSGNFEIVIQTLSMLSEQLSPTPSLYYATGALVLFFMQAAYFAWFYIAVKKFNQLFRSTKFNTIINLSNYILAFNFVALILIRNFSEPRSWNLFWARFLCLAPLFFFTYLVMDLLKEKYDNKVMAVKLQTLEQLRQSEKPYYDFVIETWQKSRRLRHDQKHLVILLNQLLERKEYDKLGENLRSILNYTEGLQGVKLYGNETVDGLVGYWQMQAQEQNIRFTTDINFSKINVNDVDLAIVLGNALQNAFTAIENSRLSIVEPFIKIIIKEKAQWLLLSVENSYSGNIVRYNDKFYSAKRGFKEPGTGLENIKLIVEKYEGTSNISFNNQSFKLQLMLQNTNFDA